MRHATLLVALLYTIGVLNAQVDVVNGDPVISVGNVNMRVMPGDKWHSSSFRIENPSAVDLIVTGYDNNDFVDSHFRIDSGLTDRMHLVIPAGGYHTVYVSYNPMDAMTEQHFASLTFSSNASGVDDLCVLWGYVDPVISVNEERSSQTFVVSPMPLNLSQHQVFNISMLNEFSREQSEFNSAQSELNTVVIYNTLGREIVRIDAGNGVVQLPSSLIPTSGMYIIRMIGTTQDVVLPMLCVD